MIQARIIFGLFTVGALASVCPADESRPNIVFILADDLGREDCGFMGGQQIKTPQLDKLAAAGAKLDAFYVQPVCSPTRAALMTGRYPMRHGLQVGVVRPWAQYGLPLEERTLPQALSEAGYATAIVGKWHLGHFAPEYLPTRRGFGHQYGHYNGAIDYFTHDRDGGFDWHRDDQACRDEGYSTHLIGKAAAKFIADTAGKQPFFLYVPFNAVHSPHQVPEEYTKAYPNLRGDRQKYAGMLAAMDEAVGVIVDAVQRAGVREKTLFIFSSDNGGPAAGPGYRQWAVPRGQRHALRGGRPRRRVRHLGRTHQGRQHRHRAAAHRRLVSDLAEAVRREARTETARRRLGHLAHSDRGQAVAARCDSAQHDSECGSPASRQLEAGCEQRGR